MENSLISKVEKWVKEIHSNADHLIRTGYWIKKIYPSANEALIIAAISHDIERAFKEGMESRIDKMKGIKWDDATYSQMHSCRSAKFVEDFLSKQKANPLLIKEVFELVSHHEEGGWKEANYLRDADSISFLETMVPFFISKIPSEISKVEVKQKFDYMFERIGSKKARILARPFYEDSLNKMKLINEF